ncbi:uncharacterized protein LOC133730438 [Rosa rugosa]|uniref:uncharacterized protein LOC133730438 n=1 Tax=Rosa rugosa TaxID=74645 RepID=UPI002B40BEB9|nr:uncharacterized protein LOC133730438 [Rosa rugosa]
MERLQRLLSQEELLWKQRSRVTWLKDGDRNTGFFHRKASNGRRKNTLNGLYDDTGLWCDDDSGMEKVVSSYFSKMFAASELDYEAMELTLDAIQPSVTPDMIEILGAQYTKEEVKDALSQMYPTKSPGPDGMPPIFFQHYWETIGSDVTAAVLSFLHSGQLLRHINFTHINILVANEVAHFLHNKRDGGEGCMALKLDLSKAYDRMDWSFLRKGKPRGLVIPSRGLRQGDPSSPYLFLIGAGDDSMIYAQASLDACYELQDVIETYGRASGQLVNFDKSSVIFSKNVSSELQGEISSLLGVEIVASHERYLGLPTYVGKKKTATFQYIKENLAKKKFSLASIISTRENLKVNSYWQIGDGSRVNVFSDCWVPELPLGKPIERPNSVGEVQLVKELITKTGYWDIPLLQALFTQEEVESISRIPLSQQVMEDRLVWKLAKDGQFSVKTTYSSSVQTSPNIVPFDLPVNGSFWQKL